MITDLSQLSAADIDGLPFGYIALDRDGQVRKYNRFEADLSRKDPNSVLGKNFFRDVAPCTQVREFEGRFRDFVDGKADGLTLSFDFEFAFRHGRQKVRIGLVRSPLEKEIIVTVNRIRDLGLSLSAELTHDAVTGSLLDANARPVISANDDFWQALDAMTDGQPGAQRRAFFHRLGKDWGWKHALRVENFVQREHGLTMREVELQIALESLSGSLGVLGLGRFDVDLEYRSRGLVLISHRGSPFVAMLARREGRRCDLLAGLFGGFLSYLSGRSLVGREIECSRSPSTPCRFVVGTERRLERFFDPVPGSADANLHVAMNISSAEPTEPGNE